MNATSAVPRELSGEDRTFGEGLYVDLIPSTCWFINVRSCVTIADWRRLRRMLLDRAGHRCELCGAVPDRHPGTKLQAHERFAYISASRVQVLRRLICLCADCHTVTHFGLACRRGFKDQAYAHLRKVNEWSTERADAHVAEAFALFAQRSRYTWSLDLSILEETGIIIVPRP